MFFRFLRFEPAVILIVLFLFGSVVPSGAEPALAPDRPNVVVFLTDDQGWGDISSTGNTTVDTPHIDSLAEDGTRFEYFYVQPVCSPTRAELLTGRYHQRSGVHDTSQGKERIDLDEHTLGKMFQDAGYATGAFGKWHSGSQYPYHPNGRGFDEFYGFTSGHWGSYFSPLLEHNEALSNGTGYLPDDLTDHALSFIEEHRDEPFFCYVPYNVPHAPMQVPDEYFERYSEDELQRDHRYAGRENPTKTRAALAMMKNVDDNVGRVLNTLDELDLTRETIVMFFSDNGPNGWRWNDNLRGKKGSTNEGGVRVPFYVRWPGRIESGQRILHIAGAIDIMPTLAGLTGVQPGNEKPFDGTDLTSLLTKGSMENEPDRTIVNHWGGNVSVRSRTYRLDNKGRLYNIRKDPGQRNNVADQHPEVVQRLKKIQKKWRKRSKRVNRNTDRPVPVGHVRSPGARIPARDGTPHGSIERSNRFPNNTFFRNWTTTSDRITWDVEVLNAGLYHARVYYTCKEKNTGAELKLSAGDSSVRTTVTEAFDPPLVGKENDRVSRKESYVKEFRPLSLGHFELEAGRTNLELTAPRIPGEEAVDVRFIELMLIKKK